MNRSSLLWEFIYPVALVLMLPLGCPVAGSEHDCCFLMAKVLQLVTLDPVDVVSDLMAVLLSWAFPLGIPWPDTPAVSGLA